MTTLLLPPRYTGDSISIAKAASRAGWGVVRLSSWHISSSLRNEDVCVYAEPLFALHASTELDLALIEPTYDWLPTLPVEYLKRDVRLITMEVARTISSPTFVKCAAEKFFRPAVIEDGSFLPAGVNDAVPVLAIEPVHFDAEFRYFVLDNRLMTSSPYWIAGLLAKNDNDQWIADDETFASATSFIEQVLKDPAVSLPAAIVVDVGRIEGRGWAIVEANPAWGSGLYGCDPAEVLPVVRRACRRASALIESDRRWIIDHTNENFV